MGEPAPYRTFRHVIGVDPGPVPGIVLVTPKSGGRRLAVDVVQCTEHVAPSILEALLADCRETLGQAPALVAIESFVVGRKSMRSGAAGSQTRDLIGKLYRVANDQPNVRVEQRNASTVKRWATDERLDATGLLTATKGMRHARDAARHALFAAVQERLIPDPLSRHAHLKETDR